MNLMKKISVQSVIDDYFKAKQEAEENREQENIAARRIQKCYRAYAIKRAYYILNFAAFEIQRVFKGYIYGRKVRNKLLEEKRLRDQNMFFDYCATIIQKIYRGYRSRKYAYNFVARQQYLQAVREKNDEVVNYVETWKQQQTALRRELKEIQELEEFHKVTDNLHHLVSTKTIPGIYRKSDIPESENTIYDVPIEDHLRATARQSFMKSLTRPKPKPITENLTAPELGTTINFIKKPSEAYLSHDKHYRVPTSTLKDVTAFELLSKLPPINERDMMRTKEKRYGPFKAPIDLIESKHKSVPKSIQNSAPYSAYEEEVRKERKLDKMMRVVKSEFVVRKPPPLKHGETLHAANPYTKPLEAVVRKTEKEKHMAMDSDFTVSTAKITKVFDSTTIPFIASQGIKHRA